MDFPHFRIRGNDSHRGSYALLLEGRRVLTDLLSANCYTLSNSRFLAVLGASMGGCGNAQIHRSVHHCL